MCKWLSSGTIADTSSIEYYVFSQSKATGEKALSPECPAGDLY